MDNLRQLTGKERLGQERSSEYLGAEDVSAGTEPLLTIAAIWNGTVTLSDGKKNKDVMSFREQSVPGILHVKPMIVNATNRKVLRKLYGEPTAEALTGKQIQIFIDHNVRDPQNGGKTDGIRIRNFVPAPPKVYKCEVCGEELTPAWNMTPEQLAGYAKKNTGRVMCARCMRAMKKETKSDDAGSGPDGKEKAE
jgi:hypothetical protein